MKSSIPSAPISYKKLNVIAGVVRKQNVNTALAKLDLMPKKGAKVLHKLIESAVANAVNNQGQKSENLIVDQVIVNKGVGMKRWKPAARGRALPRTKHSCSARVELAVVAPAKSEKKEKKAETKTKVKTTKSKSTKTETK